MPLAPGTHLGPYEISGPLGTGGMGEVYRARDTRLDRTVAIKILPAQFSSDAVRKQRFEREAKTISSLNHPNICVLHDIGSQDGVDYLVMECVEGETLAKRLEKGPLPLEQVLKYGAQIADALDKAHRSAVIHRDLKPGNIMLTATGAKLLDFGLAKPAAPLTSAATLSAAVTQDSPVTEQGTIVGTFQYMSPEQIENKELDARSDIFSLGAVLYEMVTSKRAFEGKSQLSVASAILEKEPAPISNIKPMTPPALDHAVKKCLAKLPDERWQSASDLASELKWLSETGSQAGEAGRVSVGRRRWERTAWLLAATLFLLALAGGAATIWLSRPQSHATPEVRVTELSVSLPPEMSLSPLSAPMISPNGNEVVFVAKTPDRLDSLYLRRLDTPVIRRLEGTEMARHPFWSPDSASVGFFAGAQLKRVDIASGIVQLIAEASDGRGGSWNKDGVIIFSPRASSPLFRVDALGGEPRPLTELNGQASHRWPSFLADSRHFIYTAQPGAAPGGIFLASLDDPHGQLLTAEVVNGEVANGYLLFARGATVVSAKLDVRAAKLSGENTVIIQRVFALADRNLAEFSVSNSGILTYAPGDINPFQLAWFDRTGHLLERINARDVRGELDLSPDGRRLLTDYFNPSGGGSVEIIDLQRGTATPVAGSLSFESPLWSPTGESVILGRNDIVRRWIDGSEREQVLVKSSVPLYPDDWSKDGRWLLFERVDKQKNFDLIRLDMGAKAEAEPYLQTPANEAHGRISPDGHWVAYVSDESSQAEVYVQSFPKTGGGKWRISTQGGDQPFWRGDGGELYYLAPDLALMGVPIRRAKSFDPGAPVKLFQTSSVTWGITGNRNSYVATPDGKRFLIQYLPEQAGGSFIGIVENWEQRLKATAAPQSR